METIKQKYENKALPKLQEKFGYKNKMAVPKITKVVVNIGFGKADQKLEMNKKICRLCG